jgi:hypothetical protein
VPGTASTLDDVVGESRVIETTVIACRNSLPENVQDNSALLLVENRGTNPIKLRDPAWEGRMEELNIGLAEMLDEQPRKVEPEYFFVPPGRWSEFRVVPGQELIVDGEGCIQVDANPVRFVNRK